MRYAFAGDRDIAVRVLRFLLEQGAPPSALLIPENPSHADEIISLLQGKENIASPANPAARLSGDSPTDVRSGISPTADLPVFAGKELSDWTDELASLDLDYIFGIHFPHLVPREILEIPRVGVLNLHPAYLPFNKGWHTPSWMILDDTPAGATLHFMEETLDAGDIIHQKLLEVCPSDTAHSLYRRLKDLEYEVFIEAWPDLRRLQPPRTPQPPGEGTSRRRAELAEIRRLDLDAPTTAREVLRTLRALTTDRESEAAYFEEGASGYLVRVDIKPMETP